MCGITGFVNRGSDNFDWHGCLAGMSAELVHRGPDDHGIWFDSSCGIGLAHQRLAIIDLSAHGHQPMLSKSQRYVMVFNGEIYNFAELSRQLVQLGHSFRGHSDTEVMLAAFEQWGIEPSLTRFHGMFALVLWDRHDRTLVLARDRVGEKPLYYGWSKESFLFGSELKALRKHPAWTGGIDPTALNLFFRYTYVPAPWSIHPGIFKIPPGSYLKMACVPGGYQESLHSYWSIADVARQGRENPFQGDENEALQALEDALGKAIYRQMASDVPLGAFLSGGYDSSTVVALMQKQSSTPIKTFSIGFHESEFNEAQHAKAVAKHLGTEHAELYVTQRDALDVIPLLADLYDEPFADSSQIPTYLLSKFTRQKVTVSLSGDGGDELFCGYDRYHLVESYWRKMSRLPFPLRRQAAGLAAAFPEALLDALQPATGLNGSRLKRLARLFSAASPDQLNDLMTGSDLWADAVTGPTELAAAFQQGRRLPPSFDCIASRMMVGDFLQYLPDDILVKVDRAGMGVSLETRIPLLDPALIEMVWSLPIHLKRKNRERKWLLRQVLYRHVPRTLVDRPKSGFAMPVGSWLKGALADWGEQLLSRHALEESGFLNADPVRQKWQEHLSGKRSWIYELWPVLMFQAWHQKQKELP